MKKWTALVLSLCLLLSVFGSVAAAEAAAPLDTSEYVELSMYIVNDEPVDYQMMLEAFNEKLLADLNCKLNVTFLGWSDFNTKYPLVLSSGEPIDLIYTATWLDFYQLAQKGAFMAIEDLLPVYAPHVWEQMDEGTRIQATVGGHIYAAPNGKEDYSAYGVSVRGDLMDKYNIPAIKTFEDYGNYMQIIKENEPEMQPSNLYSYGSMFDSVYLLSKGLYSLDGNIYWIDPSEDHPTVKSIADLEDIPEFLNLMRSWYEAGYWPASALSNQDSKMLETGKAASDMNNLDHWAGYVSEAPQFDFRWYLMTPTVNVLSHIQDAISVPAAAKHPERALMLLDKLRSDQSYFDLFTYGIPGVHSKILEDGSVKALSPNTFPLDPSSWGLRTEGLCREVAGRPAAYADNLAEIKSVVVPNIYRSYYMDTTEVKNEFAAVQNAISQYWVPLKMGYTDPESGLAELKEQLRLAGNDKVVEELQKQIDTFTEMWK